MMTLQELVYISLGGAFVLPGLLAIWVGVRGSEWFFRSHSYRRISDRVGLGWARILMIGVGLLLIAAAVLVIVDPMNTMKVAR